MRYKSLALLVLSLTLGGCYPSSDERFRMGEGEHSDLVVILKPEISEHEVEEFVRDNLTARGNSSGLPVGVQAIMKVSIGERTAQLINFFPDATSKQKAALETRLLEAEAVDRIFSNMTPEEAAEAMSSPGSGGGP